MIIATRINRKLFMKKISFLIVLLIMGIVFFTACEKDDICVEGNTPLLVISFYDFDDRTTLKRPPVLRTVGIGNEFAIDLKSNDNTISDRISTLDSIEIPLKIDKNTTSFAFIINSADDDMGVEIGNIDIVAFNYEKKDVFVSRACGFVANYENLSNELMTDSNNWIKEIEVVNPLVENTTETHVKIYH